MATSIGLIIIISMLAKVLFIKFKLPGLLGMLLVGMLIGPHGLNWVHKDLLIVSADIRKIALIIILLRAGLGIGKEQLKQVGNTAVKLGFLPGIIEGMVLAITAILLFDFSFIEGGILGFIIAAVSPAVVVPQMLHLKEEGLGTNKSIPTLILASSSVDDVFAITIFSTFLGFYSGSRFGVAMQILSIPVSILLGIALGAVCGLIMVKLFNIFHIRDSKKVLYLLGVGIMFTAIESLIKAKELSIAGIPIEVAGLLGVMTIGFVILEKKAKVAKRLALKYSKIWLLAELLLFTLVGAEVNVSVALNAGVKGLLLIGIGLGARSIGVLISTIGSDLNSKEKIFCTIAYMPKATVQAAIGGIPLAAGVPSGELILAMAVLSILITAPVGAIGIQLSSKKLLSKQLEKK